MGPLFWQQNVNTSLKILGDDNIFRVSNTKILIQNGTYFAQKI